MRHCQIAEGSFVSVRSIYPQAREVSVTVSVEIDYEVPARTGIRKYRLIRSRYRSGARWDVGARQF